MKMEIKSVTLVINFCLLPLNKENIIKVTIEIDDFLLLRDALLKSISIYNSLNSASTFTLSHEFSLYKLRISKKSGLPDTDLPGIEQNLKIKDSNLRSFSVTIEENMKIKPNSNGMNDISLKVEDNNLNGSFENPHNKSVLLLETNQKKKKCCACMVF